VGATVEVKIKRGGEAKTLSLVTDELTTVRSEEENFEMWGFVGQNITDRLARREKLPDTKGVYVTGVRRGEPAEEAGVEEDDIIVRAGTHDVADVAALLREYEAAGKAKQDRVLLRVRRGQGVVPVLLKIAYPAEPAGDEPRKEKPAGDARQGKE